MTSISRTQFASLLGARRVVLSALTNLQAGRFGMNIGKTTSSDYGRVYIDYTKRSYGKWFVPGTGTPVALDGNGNPAASYEFNLSGNPLANDLGVYNCWCDGQISGVAKSSSTTTTAVTFSTPAYTAGDNKTRFQMTVVSGGGNLGLVVSNPTASTYLRILPATINGVAVTESQSNDFHPDCLTQMSMGLALAPHQVTLRGLDWLSTNGNVDINWAASVAAGQDGSVRLGTQSLAELCRFANANNSANLYTEIPTQVSNSYIATYMALIDAQLDPGSVCYVGFGSEASWNTQFSGYSLMVSAACNQAGTYAGATARFPGTQSITSCSRDGAGTATAVVTGPPRNAVVGTSKLFVSGITSITGGYVTLTASVNNGDGTYSVSWAETGAAVTGAVINGPNNYASYIHTDVEPGAPNYLVLGAQSYGNQPANNYVGPPAMKGRFVIERLRQAWTAAQSLATGARFRFVLNNKVGSGAGNGVSENEAYPYALDRWGDHSWLYTVCSAPYFSSETAAQAATSAAGVITALQSVGGLSVNAYPALLVKEGTACASWGKPKMYYEGGPANTKMGAAGTYIGQAHRDITLTPSMFDLQTIMLNTMRDVGGQAGAFCFYQGGSRAAFGGADNSCWPLHEGGVISDMTQPKPAALKAWLLAPVQPLPVDGYTSGTISLPLVWSSNFGSGDANGCRIVPNTAVLTDLVVRSVKTVAGNYPINIRVCSSVPTDWITILINGVEVAHQIALTSQNPQGAAPATDVWASGSYPHVAGENKITLRVQPTGRAGLVGFNQIVSPDTPV
jgi:hypothetical protein